MTTLQELRKRLVSEMPHISLHEQDRFLEDAYEKWFKKRLNKWQLYTDQETLPASFERSFNKWVKIRKEGLPQDYIFQQSMFMGETYRVTPDVLIPRQETEGLVLEVQKYFDAFLHRPKLGWEVGLGSGVVSIECLKYWPLLKMVASEVSSPARVVARTNAEKILGPSEKNLTILAARNAFEVFEPFSNSVRPEFIVSNPPYLKSREEMEPQVWRYEPHEALLPLSPDPLYFYSKIAEEAPQFLADDGVVFMEIPHERSHKIIKLFSKWQVEIKKDMNARDRYLVARVKKIRHVS